MVFFTAASENFRHAQGEHVGYTFSVSNKVPPPAPAADPWRQRLRAAIDETGLSYKEVSRRAGLNETAVHYILNTATYPRIDTLASICQVVGKSLSNIYDGTERVHLAIKVLGVTTGVNMWADVPPKHVKVIPFQLFTEQTVTVEISDDGLAPRFDRGDVVSGPKTPGPYLDNLIGSDCIVELLDGSKHIAILLRGGHANTFTLRSLNPRGNDIRDVPIRWAAPDRKSVV